MKFSFTFLLILILQSIVTGQVFAPIGSKWYVKVVEPFDQEWSGTLTNESMRDTMIKGLNCRIINKSQATIFNEIYGEYSICQSGDSIFHHIKTLDSLNLVMDFGAKSGDYWESFDQANNFESFGTEQNYRYYVDSVGTLVTQDNLSLTVQYITEYTKLWGEPDSMYRFPRQRQLIQHIGFRSALLPSNNGDGFTDDQYESEVRCYEDSNIGLIKITNDENCTTSATRDINSTNIKIYPNPVIDYLSIDLPESRGHLTISDLSGRQLVQTRLEDLGKQSIDVSELLPGLYIVDFTADTGDRYLEKLIKG